VSVSCSNDECDKLRRNYGCQIGSNDHFHYCIAYFCDSVVPSLYRPLFTFLGKTKGRFTHNMPCPCRFPAMLCRKGFRICLSHLIYTVRPCLIHTCHAAPMPCFDHAVLLKDTAQHGRRETACGLPARVRLLPATTRSSTKIVIRSIPILLTTIHTYDCKEW
jgi:hypothetical protein